ncbi:MAG: TonB-dependent receptor [Bacteroidales bacterium]|jgi:TonB-linked SusC/RagA family outer membrane protein|nr:TonB-dependent receptor [Bacteroidales bacterium]
MKKLLLLLVALLSVLQINAQQLISGKVVDDTEMPLPGVSVQVQNTLRGTFSGTDGSYTIMAQPADTLIFRMLGMIPKKEFVGNRTIINVTMFIETNLMEEVVVIGYGVVKRSDLTGSVSSVKAEDLLKITSLNPEQGLQGKVTGVQVSSTSGAPGAGATIRVRGVGTFNNSSPIFVVDGVILDDVSFLNTSDIASMEVLKDASATAIYGSRGANGVIIITTKTGTPGQGKASFDFSSEIGIQSLARKIDLLNGREFAVISNEITPGSYNNVDLVPDTDWQDLIFQNAPVQNHQFSITGATEVSQYYVGVGMFIQDGIIDKSSYSRFTLKLNNTYNLSPHIRLGNNLTLAPYRQENAPNVTYSAYRAQPLLKPFYDDNSFAVVYNVGNPLADLSYSNNFGKGIRGVGNIFAEAAFLKSFTLRSSLGVDASYNKSSNFTPAYTVYNPDGTASQQQNVLSDLFKGNSENLTWLWENTLAFKKTFSDIHALDIIAGFTMQETSSESIGLSGENVLRDGKDFWYMNPAYIYDPSTNVNKIQSIFNGVDPGQFYSMISYLFRTNYTLHNKYILTFTFRRDGSSKFSSSNRFSNFPSFALGWNVGKESFMRSVPFISNLKLRGSWGMIGNEKISYYDRYSRVHSGLLAVLGNPDAPLPAASYGKNGNPDLRWESTTQTDLGAEIGFFKNRLNGEFDYYNRKTDDILVELSTPGHLGNGQGQKVRYNAASVLNSGFEFNLSWKESRGDFTYKVGILGSTIHNEVLSIGGNNSGIDSLLIGGYLGDGRPVTLSRVGLPIGAFYGYKTDGIFQSEAELDAYPHTSQAEAGDLRFVDVNPDGIIDGNDRTYIGSPVPKLIFGFNAEIEYKGIDFSFDFQGQTGNKIFNGKEVVRPDPYNFEKHVIDRWTGPGTSNKEPKPSFGGYNYTPSDRFIQDGSFIRLRSVTLGYTIPPALTNKASIQKLRFYIKGSNILTLTRFKGYSPEIGSYDVLSNGIDFGIYPITSTYSFGVNLTF